MRIAANVVVALCFAATLTPLASATPPNHVVLNERRKHIDADSSWLDKTSQNVEHVNMAVLIVMRLIAT